MNSREFRGRRGTELATIHRRRTSMESNAEITVTNSGAGLYFVVILAVFFIENLYPRGYSY